MYTGLSKEVIPTPIPAAKRMNTKKEKEPAIAMPADDTAKINAATHRPGFLPYLSENRPVTRHPTMHPNPREPVRNPSSQTSRTKSFLKNGSAPDITAKSNPNKYPPNAEIREIKK